MQELEIIRVTLKGEGDDLSAHIELGAGDMYTEEERGEIIQALGAVSQFIVRCIENQTGGVVQ